MGAKTILKRYMERHADALPREKEKLRQRLSAVAKSSGLAITESELLELVPEPAPKRQKKAAETAAPENGGDVQENEFESV